MTEGMDKVNLLPYMFHYWDENGQIADPKPQDTHRLESTLSSFDFKPVTNPGDEYVLGQGNSGHWLKFCVFNPSNKAQMFVLAASPAIIAKFDFYPQKPGLPVFQTGSKRVMSTRDIPSADFHFDLDLQARETLEFYIRVESRTNAYLIASVSHKPRYLVSQNKVESIDGMLAGIVLGLILYAILLYLSARQSSLMFYILWSTSTLVLFAAIDGRVLQYVLPNNPSLAYLTTVIFYPLTIILTALFARDFIKLRNHPRLDLICAVIIAGYTLALGIAYQYGYAIYFKTTAIFAFTAVVYIGLMVPLYAFITTRSVQAKYLLISQLPLIICILDRNLFSVGLTAELYIPYTPKVGLVIVIILLTYCIGLGIYSEKDQAQRLSLEQLQISNDLKNNYNAELEAEIKINTADLEAQATKLAHLDNVKSKFFANVSHEFRTPLTLIQGPLNDLLAQDNLANKDVISGVLKHSKSLQALIDQLLVLSKFDGDSLDLKTQKTNISDAISIIASQFQSLVESNGLTLNFATHVPQLELFVDHEKLQVMLNNLLSNAIKFTPAGGQISITLSLDSGTELNSEKYISDEYVSDEYLNIEVADTGHGIPSSELEFVFDRFFQSRTAINAGSGTGTGIGLALVKELALMHAGDISVSSDYISVNHGAAAPAHAKQHTSGTRFTLRLPLGSAHLQVNEIIQPTAIVDDELKLDHRSHTEPLIDNVTTLITTPFATSAQTANPKPNATILIVDDNHDMRAYLRGLLTPDYNVLEATDGIDAEHAVNKTPPDLIVTDLMMPKRNGLEFVQSLKKNGDFAKIPVIMLTARAGMDDRLEGLVAAVDDYLAKPFDARELKVRIENLLIKHAQFQAFYQTDTPELPHAKAVKRNGNGNGKPNHKAYTTKFKDAVERHLADPNFGVAELAAQMHMSRATLHRQLSNQTGFTPSEFIRHCRLEKARQLAELGNINSVAELASAVGFKQAAYFSRLYKKAFNTLPPS